MYINKPFFLGSPRHQPPHANLRLSLSHMMTTSLPWHHPLLPSNLPRSSHPIQRSPRRHVAIIQAFRHSDFVKDAWRSANEGFEQLLYDVSRSAFQLDRRFSLSRRFDSAARSATDRARDLDRQFEIGRRWRTFSMDFTRNWPRYRRELSGFLETRVGKSSATIFFVWFALSGWLFNFLILATWVLPIAAPLLIGTVANNFVIKGECPACKRQFMGYRNQVIQCTGCRNIVWRPGSDSRGTPPSSSSEPDIIDIEIEEK